MKNFISFFMYINDSDREVSVEGIWSKGFAGSYFEPPEDPEFDIQEVKYVDTGEDVPSEVLSEEEIYDAAVEYLHGLDDTMADHSYDDRD